jgi:hypothetical protein
VPGQAVRQTIPIRLQIYLPGAFYLIFGTPVGTDNFTLYAAIVKQECIYRQVDRAEGPC